MQVRLHRPGRDAQQLGDLTDWEIGEIEQDCGGTYPRTQSFERPTQIEQLIRQIHILDRTHTAQDPAPSSAIPALVQQTVDRHSPDPTGRVIQPRYRTPSPIGCDERFLHSISDIQRVERDPENAHQTRELPPEQFIDRTHFVHDDRDTPQTREWLKKTNIQLPTR